jgi:hypothetical protein
VTRPAVARSQTGTRSRASATSFALDLAQYEWGTPGVDNHVVIGKMSVPMVRFLDGCPLRVDRGDWVCFPDLFDCDIRSDFDADVTNIYDDEVAQKRYERLNATFCKFDRVTAEELKKKC